MKVFCAAFLYLQFVIILFCQKNISRRVAQEMLVKLTTGRTRHGGRMGQGNSATGTFFDAVKM